jgi:hypothetical protein
MIKKLFMLALFAGIGLAFAGKSGTVYASNDFANVQGKAVVGSATSSVNVSFDDDVTAGDLVVVSIGQRSTTTLPTAPTDSQSNTYSTLGGNACGLGSAADRSLQTWYTFATSTGPLSVTVQSPNAAYQVVMREFSGSFNTPDPVDYNGSTPAWGAYCQHSATTLYGTPPFNVLSVTGDGLSYSVSMSPNSTTYSLDGFGGWSGSPGNYVFNLDNSLSAVSGSTANASAKGSIIDGYVLDVPISTVAEGQFHSTSAIEALSQTIVFRHN